MFRCDLEPVTLVGIGLCAVSVLLVLLVWPHGRHGDGLEQACCLVAYAIGAAMIGTACVIATRRQWAAIRADIAQGWRSETDLAP